MNPRIAIIGGGIAGITAAWQLAQLDQNLHVTLYEASSRLGGTVETIRHQDFIIETGPDGWITEKPWARDLAMDLGLADQLIPSNDDTRVTYILRQGKLVPIPEGMRMMVPTDLAALANSPLFSQQAIEAYAAEPTRAAELRALAPAADESVATFVARHFGPEVLNTIAAPLLSGVFGGDVAKLSVQSVMPRFVEMERTHGSLILALQAARPAGAKAPAIFTSLQGGTATLIDRMVEAIPPDWLRLDSRMEVSEDDGRWIVQRLGAHSYYETVDHLIMATPAHATQIRYLPQLKSLLPTHESSAIIAAFAFEEDFDLPPGFGFLVPAGEDNPLLAGTFVDQKYPGRCAPGHRLIRAFFGGEAEPENDLRTDEQLARIAFAGLEKILGPLPRPAHTVVRRWPRSLPQYEVGHGERIAQLDRLLGDRPTLHLLGNAYRGVGLPDLIRDARNVVRGMAFELP